MCVCDVVSDVVDDVCVCVCVILCGLMCGGVCESVIEGVDYVVVDDECGLMWDGVWLEIFRLRARSTRANAFRGGRCCGCECVLKDER